MCGVVLMCIIVENGLWFGLKLMLFFLLIVSFVCGRLKFSGWLVFILVLRMLLFICLIVVMLCWLLNVWCEVFGCVFFVFSILLVSFCLIV